MTTKEEDMGVIENRQDAEVDMKSVLKKYLEQYTRKRKRKEILQKRLHKFKEEMLGTKAVNYSLVPKSQTNNISNEPVDFYIH